MGKLSWLFMKNKVINLINNADVKALKQLVDDQNLDEHDRDEINVLFVDTFELDVTGMLEMFNENGQFIGDSKEYLYYPSIINFIIKADPSTKEGYNEKEEQLLSYYNKEISTGRNKELTYIFDCIRDEMYLGNDTIEKYFDGTKLTDSAYEIILKRLLTIRIETKDLSQELKNHFTPFELNLIETMHKSNYYSTTMSELISVLKREDIPKCISIKGYGIKATPEIIISNESLPLMIYVTNIKMGILNSYKDKNELKEKLHECLNEVQTEYFMLVDGDLDIMFQKLRIGVDEIDTFMYLKDGKIAFTPHFVSKLLDNKQYDDLFYVLCNYFDKDQYKYIKVNDPDININSLIKVSNIYENIKKIESNRKKELISGFNPSTPISFILENLEEGLNILHLNIEDLDNFEDVLLDLCNRIYNSNAQELKTFGSQILYQILNNGKDYNYKEALDRIEEIFTKNNLPEAAKKFLIFQILTPNIDKHVINHSAMSPTLASVDVQKQYEIIFSDIMRITLGSNNILFKKYLENIYRGNSIYTDIIANNKSIGELQQKDKEVLEEFLGHLCAIYNNSKKGKEEQYTLTGDLTTDLNKLIPLFKPTGRHSLPDRIIRMYCYKAGFKSFDEVREYMNKTTLEADKRGRELASKPFSLEVGDMVKGIGDIKYLYDILQNGSLCKEFLGPHMDSDATPLDTDLSMIMKKGLTISDTMSKTKSDFFGPIYFVIKKGKFPMTRTKKGAEAEFTTTGPECFTTLSDDHLGVRTGFASSDIDYIMIDQGNKPGFSIEEIGFITALNGIYIPIIDKKSGELLFTPNQYDDIRNKMGGLSYYGTEEFKLSNHLEVPKDYDNKTLIEDAQNKKSKINSIMGNILKTNFDYDLRTKLTADISTGSVDFIDTGSTGRGTNVGISSDFDFVMRIDERADKQMLAMSICEGLGIDYEKAKQQQMILGNGNLRLKGVKVEDITTPIDMDITFLSKADKFAYTTDMAISDKLESIKSIYPDKYEDVLDNIIYAKEYLKSKEVYKPNHSPESQGGLGGVGIENWVLQNGGSFYEACKSFCDTATEHGSVVPFEKFVQKYKIYDFGVNFYNNNHDEFVRHNMDNEGYTRMYKAVKEYVMRYEQTHDISKTGQSNTNTLSYDVEQESISYDTPHRRR